MAHYPTSPIVGDVIGRNMLLRPRFDDLVTTNPVPQWDARMNNAVYATKPTASTNGGAIGIRALSKNFGGAPSTGVNTYHIVCALPGIPVTPSQTFKIAVQLNNYASAAKIGIRPVGSGRITATANLPKATTNAPRWITVTDSLLAGDTTGTLELYIENQNTSAASIYFQNIRVDYDDGAPGDANDYLDGLTPDTPTRDYSWDGAAYISPSTVKVATDQPVTPPDPPPTAPIVFRANATKVHLNWTAPAAGAPPAGYNVYADGVKHNTAPAPHPPVTYVVDGLSPTLDVKSYAFTVTTLDASGNESAESPPGYTGPPIPQNLHQTPLGYGSGNDYNHMELVWDPVTHYLPVKYNIYEGLSLQNKDNDYPIVEATWIAQNLTIGHADFKHFAVTAVEDSGLRRESPKSPEITAYADFPPFYTEVQIQGVTFTTATISWALANYDDIVGYDIWVCNETAGDNEYKHNATMIPEDPPWVPHQYTIDGLMSGCTYTVFVNAWDVIGQCSDQRLVDFGLWPGGEDFHTPEPGHTPPTAPTNLRVITQSATTVSLTWNRSYIPDNLDVRPFYVIYENGEVARDKDGKGIGTVGTDADGTHPAIEHTLTNLAPGSTHHYVVHAIGAYYVLSEPSEPLTVTLTGGTPPPPDIPPTAPTALHVTGITDTTIGLAWNASTDDIGVVGYHVYLDGVRFTGGAPVTELTYTIAGLTPGTSYNLLLKAVDTTAQTSPFSNGVSATTTGTAPAPNIPPTAPTGLIVTGITDTTVGLAWDASTDDSAVARYDIFRGGALIGNTTGLTFIATALTPGTSYSFTVRAVDDDYAISPSSAAVIAATTGAVIPVAPPSGLHTTAVTDTTVELAWDESPDDIAGYYVYRGGTLIGQTTTELTYTATGLAPGTQYSFTVKALGTNSYLSAASNAVTAVTTGTEPPTGPPPQTVTGDTVATFLQQPDNPALVMVADPLAEAVTLLAQGYTRGVGFTAGQPNQEIAAVITLATARLAAHPEQIPQVVGAVHHPSGGFSGWSLPELFVLNRYRKRGA